MSLEGLTPCEVCNRSYRFVDGVCPNGPHFATGGLVEGPDAGDSIIALIAPEEEIIHPSTPKPDVVPRTPPETFVKPPAKKAVGRPRKNRP